MTLKLALLLCIATMLSACASQPLYVPAPCPKRPAPPAVLMQPLPTLDLLPRPAEEDSMRSPTMPLPSAAPLPR